MPKTPLPKTQDSQKPLILLIDDDTFFLNMYRLKLEIEGFKVITATGAEDGLKLFKTKKPNLVFLDIYMPQKDGFYFLKKIKAGEEKTAVPIVLLTNLDGQEIREKACKYGILYYICKADKLPRDLANLAWEILGQKK